MKEGTNLLKDEVENPEEAAKDRDLTNTAVDQHISPEIQKALTLLNGGSMLVKVRSRFRKNARRFVVGHKDMMLEYTGSRKVHCWRQLISKTNDQREIYITDIKEVREGVASAVFDRSFIGHRPPEENCFTLVVGGEDSPTLDLVAPDPDTQRLWVTGIKYLVDKMKILPVETLREKWIEEAFRETDKNKNGILELSEIIDLVNEMNMPLTYEEAAASTRKTSLNLQEFKEFIMNITMRSEIEELFKKYSKGKDHLEAAELVAFFKEEEDEVIELADIQHIIDECESCPNVKKMSKLSVYGFCEMFKRINKMDVRHPRCQKVYQDMTQPLSHYYIDSSHNTYLESHQLHGNSTTETYIKALSSGCRCVELDVWNGSNGEPIVYHGYTMTTKILFKDVLKAIEKYAFKTSEYPVILSLENHCSIDQQNKMAKELKDCFGNKLLIEPLSSDVTCLPSPENLKGKVIVKAKKLPEVSPDDAANDEYCTSEEDEAAEMDDEEVRRQVQKAKASREKKSKLAADLSDCVVICQAASFKNFEHSKESQSFKQMSSFGESEALELAASQSSEFLEYNTRQLSRIYPAGSRVESTNYNPVPMWNAGCQIVALNYQTPDKARLINKGLFSDNGCCGFVLKPDFLRDPNSTFNPKGPFPPEWEKTLEIKIISGYALPKKKGDATKTILDPYVLVNMLGVESDMARFQTAVVQDNGFHPVWNEMFTFTVRCPKLALLLFRVYDSVSMKEDTVVAQQCLPFESLQTGLRTLKLKETMGDDIEPASLLMQLKIK